MTWVSRSLLATLIAICTTTIGRGDEPKPRDLSPQPSGQTPQSTRPRVKPTKPKAAASGTVEDLSDAATIEKIMETAVRNIARRYNLNDKQRERTMQIMKRDVYRFLEEHEAEVWPLIKDLIGTKLGNESPKDRELLKRIGRTAKPILKAAQEAILRANKEWRTYLTEDQKRMHEYDLQEMDKTFEQLGENLDSWARGGTLDGPLFPPPPPPKNDPPRPRRPGPGLPENPGIVIFEPNLFDTHVTNFIKENMLDEGQIDSARSILSEYKDNAIDYSNSKKTEFARVAAAWMAAQDAGDHAKWAAAEEERKELQKPINELFQQMNERLVALLTSAQRIRYAERERRHRRKSQPVRKSQAKATPAAKPSGTEEATPPKTKPTEPKSGS